MISKEAKDPEVKYLGKKSLSKDSEVKMGGIIELKRHDFCLKMILKLFDFYHKSGLSNK